VSHHEHDFGPAEATSNHAHDSSSDNERHHISHDARIVIVRYKNVAARLDGDV